MLVSSVVPGTGVSLRVLVGHGGSQSVKDSSGGNILRGNENDGFTLTLDLEVLITPRAIRTPPHNCAAIQQLKLTMIAATSGSLSLRDF